MSRTTVATELKVEIQRLEQDLEGLRLALSYIENTDTVVYNNRKSPVRKIQATRVVGNDVKEAIFLVIEQAGKPLTLDEIQKRIRPLTAHLKWSQSRQATNAHIRRDSRIVQDGAHFLLLKDSSNGSS